MFDESRIFRQFHRNKLRNLKEFLVDVDTLETKCKRCFGLKSKCLTLDTCRCGYFFD